MTQTTSGDDKGRDEVTETQTQDETMETQESAPGEDEGDTDAVVTDDEDEGDEATPPVPR